eukprot:2526226-Amphidinium_carterae.1
MASCAICQPETFKKLTTLHGTNNEQRRPIPNRNIYGKMHGTRAQKAVQRAQKLLHIIFKKHYLT